MLRIRENSEMQSWLCISFHGHCTVSQYQTWVLLAHYCTILPCYLGTCKSTINAVTMVLQTAAFLRFAISTLHGHCTVSQYQTWVFVNFSNFTFPPFISLSPWYTARKKLATCFFFDRIFVCKVQFNTDNQLLAIKIWQKLAQGDKAPIEIAASHVSVGTKEEDNVIKPQSCEILEVLDKERPKRGG